MTHLAALPDLFRIQQIPIGRAYLCPDCDSVIDSAVLCPCGNMLQIHSLAAVLNRVKEEVKP